MIRLKIPLTKMDSVHSCGIQCLLRCRVVHYIGRKLPLLMLDCFLCNLLVFFGVSSVSFMLNIEACNTDVSVGAQLLSGETLLQEKNSTGHRWDLNKCLCR